MPNFLHVDSQRRTWHGLKNARPHCFHLTPTTQFRVSPFDGMSKSAARRRQRDTQGQCILPPPTPDPEVGYVSIGTGQRCKEAILIDLRRRLEEDRHRGLRLGPNPTYPTAEECYECMFVRAAVMSTIERCATSLFVNAPNVLTHS